MLFWHIENLISNVVIGNFNMMILILTVFKISTLKPIFGNTAQPYCPWSSSGDDCKGRCEQGLLRSGQGM